MLPFRPTSTAPLRASLRAWGRSRDGGVAVTVAVMTVALVGVLALAIDVGRLYNASSDLNHAADAYALAGATQLDGSDGACLRAIQVVNESVLANEEVLGSNTPGSVAYVSPIADPLNNPNIKFLSELVKDADGNVTGTYITNANKCDEDAQFIEITLDLADDNNPYRVDYYFAGITGALAEAFPQGYAIAENAKAFCITVPLMVCALDSHPQVTALNKTFMEALEDYDLTGNGLFFKSAKQNEQWGDGNFGFLDLDKGPLKFPIEGDVQCLTDGDIFTKTGSTSGARKSFNTRFDMWHGDVVGDIDNPSYQPSPNAVKGWIRTGGSCAYSPGGYEDPPTPYTGYGSYGAPPSQATLPAQAAMPFPRDNCSYSGTCQGFQGRMGDGEWDRATYMEVNHPGFTPPGGWNPPSDMDVDLADVDPWDMNWPGGSHPDGKWSRYEMYLWELDRPYASYNAHGGNGGGFEKVGPNHRIPDNTGAPDGPDTIPQTGEYAGDANISGDGLPQCYTGAMGASGTVSEADYDRDRRVERVLVVNCDPNNGGVLVQGKTEIPFSAIDGTMDVFLLEPWQVNGGVHEISTEIIGPGGVVEDEVLVPDTVREWVQLKEGRNALK